ncbi:MAG: YggS family pyridoxal phosphate-dependent enzyme [Verrucomicrobiota bacterium]
MESKQFQEMQERSEKICLQVEAALEKSGRNPSDLLILPASKKQTAETLEMAMELGFQAFGENRVQEAKEKIHLLPSHLRWDLIGSLQTNKARDAVEYFEFIHSVDRDSLVLELEKRASNKGKDQKILIEVNVAGEASKHGVAVEDLLPLSELTAQQSHLEVHGLMGMAPHVDEPEKARPYFVRLRELRDDLETQMGWRLPELSMGMSNDYPIAIEEGSTMVRIGTSLFGAR